MFKLKIKGDWKKTERFLQNAQKLEQRHRAILEKYGNAGVLALSNATPVDSGLTAYSWDYTLESSSSGLKVIWHNRNVVNGVNIALIIQYGHGTGTGGYVQGRDYINPVMQAVFDKMAEDLWKEVTSL